MKLSKFPPSVFVFYIFLYEAWGGEVPRPRGVSLSRASLYDPSKDFTCLDNSLTIPFTQVNDDYCDCPDGSDEPGTSACPHGTFYCANTGHKSLNIASSRVNDGICDCCDASDEYLKTKCVNNCKELGRTAREEAQRRAELLKEGKELRAQLSEQGVKFKQEKKEKLVELQKQKIEAEKVLKEKEEAKKEVEALEMVALEQYRKLEEEYKQAKQQAQEAILHQQAVEVLQKLDLNQDGSLDWSELQENILFDKNHDGSVSEEEAKSFLLGRDKIDLQDGIVEYYSEMKPYLNNEAPAYTPPATNEGEVEEVELDSTKSSVHEDEEDVQPSEDEEEEEEEEFEEDEAAREQEEPPMEGITYDEETQELINKAKEARDNFNEIEKAVKNLDSDIKSIEEYLQKDFGPGEAYAALEGDCFEYQDYEYIYKLCPYDKATQKQKAGSLETRLGTWSKWNGPEHNKYEVMLFENGQTCWNGPQRSTSVNMRCGSANKLIAVSEPNRCEYLYEFETPAACFEVPEDNQNVDKHDEL